MRSHLQFTEQSPCSTSTKAGVANAIQILITINLRKQLASAETLNNKVSLQKQVA